MFTYDHKNDTIGVVVLLQLCVMKQKPQNSTKPTWSLLGKGSQERDRCSPSRKGDGRGRGRGNRDGRGEQVGSAHLKEKACTFLQSPYAVM